MILHVEVQSKQPLLEAERLEDEQSLFWEAVRPSFVLCARDGEVHELLTLPPSLTGVLSILGAEPFGITPRSTDPGSYASCQTFWFEPARLYCYVLGGAFRVLRFAEHQG